MLELLQSSRFREALRHEDRANELARLQISHWATHRLVSPVTQPSNITETAHVQT